MGNESYPSPRMKRALTGPADFGHALAGAQSESFGLLSNSAFVLTLVLHVVGQATRNPRTVHSFVLLDLSKPQGPSPQNPPIYVAQLSLSVISKKFDFVLNMAPTAAMLFLPNNYHCKPAAPSVAPSPSSAAAGKFHVKFSWLHTAWRGGNSRKPSKE